VLAAARGVVFGGRAERGGGLAYVYGHFLDTGAFFGRVPTVFSYQRWTAMPADSLHVGAGAGGGGAGGDGRIVRLPDTLDG
jgi:hypothetical protein